MNLYLSVLKNSPLFKGIAEKNINDILKCLSSYTKTYEKDEYIFNNGDYIAHIGLVLYGSIYIIKEDFWGNRSIISKFSAGDIFAETYACLNTEPLGVSVVSAEKVEVMFLDIKEIMSLSSHCKFHPIIMGNLLNIVSAKNLILSRKIDHITKRSTRGKILSYLSSQSILNSKDAFEIPFNRQQLADYLSVDRSAMSKELSLLQREGILEFKKNKFRLLKNNNY